MKEQWANVLVTFFNLSFYTSRHKAVDLSTHCTRNTHSFQPDLQTSDVFRSLQQQWQMLYPCCQINWTRMLSTWAVNVCAILPWQHWGRLPYIQSGKGCSCWEWFIVERLLFSLFFSRMKHDAFFVWFEAAQSKLINVNYYEDYFKEPHVIINVRLLSSPSVSFADLWLGCRGIKQHPSPQLLLGDPQGASLGLNKTWLYHLVTHRLSQRYNQFLFFIWLFF